MRYQERDGGWQIERHGNVFYPAPVKAGQSPLSIAYSYGPEPIGKKQTGVSPKTPIWTCPVYAVPSEVFDLLQLFHECRLFHLPPVQGGLLDQPLMVRRSFPVFEQEMLRVEATHDSVRAQHAALATGAAIMGAMFGKGT